MTSTSLDSVSTTELETVTGGYRITLHSYGQSAALRIQAPFSTLERNVLSATDRRVGLKFAGSNRLWISDRAIPAHR